MYAAFQCSVFLVFACVVDGLHLPTSIGVSRDALLSNALAPPSAKQELCDAMLKDWGNDNSVQSAIDSTKTCEKGDTSMFACTQDDWFRDLIQCLTVKHATLTHGSDEEVEIRNAIETLTEKKSVCHHGCGLCNRIIADKGHSDAVESAVESTPTCVKGDDSLFACQQDNRFRDLIQCLTVKHASLNHGSDEEVSVRNAIEALTEKKSVCHHGCGVCNRIIADKHHSDAVESVVKSTPTCDAADKSHAQSACEQDDRFRDVIQCLTVKHASLIHGSNEEVSVRNAIEALTEKKSVCHHGCKQR